MNTLFDKTEINGMKLNNRLVRSATWEGMCEKDGRPGKKLSACYADLARGQVGLIITGYTFVRPDGKQLPGKMGIHTDDFAGDMKALTERVHSEGGRICIQLVHAGGQTDARNAGCRPVAPSSIEAAQFPELPEELTKEKISEIISAFHDGAARAKAWGFDAVQIHGAHGYLINQFLSPLTNRRTDEYGGSAENRARFLREVYAAVRKAAGPDYPVLIKLNGSDNLEGGLTIEDAIEAARRLSEAGIDAIEVSAGTPASGEKSPARMKIKEASQEAYNLDLAREIKAAVSCPVMVVGGFRSYETAAGAVSKAGMDYVSMARPFIREPGLAKRWAEGDRSRAKCISCNGCFKPGLKEGGIYCIVEAKEKRAEAK